jgi:hypothetical protein
MIVVCCYILLVLFQAFSCQAEEETSPPSQVIVDLLHQSNAKERIYDFRNKIRCYNMTEILGSPSINAVDDFVLIPPPLSLFPEEDNGMECYALNFTLNTIRTYETANPLSVTIHLFYNDPSTNRPGKLFFQRTLSSPNNTGLWDDVVNAPRFTTFIITQGDLDDDNVTVFDLKNTTFLPPYQTLWFGFYGKGPRDYSARTFRENSMFWITLNDDYGSTPLINPLYENVTTNVSIENYHFHVKIIDPSNQFGLHYDNWTDANITQGILGVSTNTFNMAWQVQMICNRLTLSPTNTILPTTVSPTNPDIIVIIPPSDSPTLEKDINGTSNGSGKGDTSSKSTQIVLPTIGLLFLCSIFGCFFFCVYKIRQRRAQKKLEQSTFYEDMKDHEDRTSEMLNDPIQKNSPHINVFTTSEDEMKQKLDYIGSDVFPNTDDDTGGTNDESQQQRIDNDDDNDPMREWVNINLCPTQRRVNK